MPIINKTITFSYLVTGSEALDANTVALSTYYPAGWYPQTYAGLTAGFFGATGSIDYYDNATAPSRKFARGLRPSSPVARVRIDLPGYASGTVSIKLQTYMDTGLYATTGIIVRDSDNINILFQQPIADVITAGDSVGSFINTAGTKTGSVDADPGVVVIPSSSTIHIELPYTGSFFKRLTNVEISYITGQMLTANAFQVVAGTLSNPVPFNTPVNFSVEAIDTGSSNARVLSYTGSVTVGVEAPFPSGSVVISGTLTRTAVAGVANFTNIYFSSSSIFAQPTIISIVPTSGPAANTVIITGTNFMG